MVSIAPTIGAGKSQAQAPASGNPSTQAPPPMIPFTRAARKASSKGGQQYGPITLTTAQQQLPNLAVPANGFLRRLTLDVTITSTGNSVAGVTFQNDGPFNILQNLTFQAANGASLITQIDGFALAMLNKYGAFSSQTRDPLADPTYSKTEGNGATAGSAHFLVDIPCEVDARDAMGALQNMAANQSFQLNANLNTIAQMYTTAPTNAPTVTIIVTAEYWQAPAAANLQGVPQQTAPRNNDVVSLIQSQTPPVVPSSDQNILLQNVGNTIRSMIFIARDASNVRTETDWPQLFQLLINNQPVLYKTYNTWRRQMGFDYGITGGLAAKPTVNTLDNGVFVLTDFMNDGSPGDGRVSGASNRDLMLVTGSQTGLNIQATNWGANMSKLLVLTHALQVQDPAAFYAPLGI